MGEYLSDGPLARAFHRLVEGAIILKIEGKLRFGAERRKALENPVA